jgi:hypothetical protein
LKDFQVKKKSQLGHLVLSVASSLWLGREDRFGLA